jgi:putative spermidine/putrescine transport system substrate-binding protein/putrescine transport system substrate-binding protein
MDRHNAGFSAHKLSLGSNQRKLSACGVAFLDNPAVYPPQAVLDTLFPIQTLSPAGMRLSTRLWTRVISGK